MVSAAFALRYDMVYCHIPKWELRFATVAVTFLFAIECVLVCAIVWDLLTAFGYISSVYHVLPTVF